MKAAIVVIAALAIAGCGGGNPAAPDAMPGDDAPDASDFDAEPLPPPACIVPNPANPGAAPCQECLVSAALPQSASECTAEVCGFDLSCCTTGWTERCTELADLRCPDLQCVNAVSFGGDAVTIGWHDGAAWQGTVVPASGDIVFDTVSWGDYDGDGDVDLATASGCYARIFRNDGWDGGEVELTSVFAHEPFTDCRLGAGPFFRGTRARWADLDRDGDLDAAFSGDNGVFWARQTASSFALAGAIVPTGPVSDFAMVDVDDDGDLDAFVGHQAVDAYPGLYRRDTAGWTADSWAGVTSQTLTVEPCDLVGDTRPEIIFAGYGNTEAYQLAGGTVGPSAFSPGPGVGLSSGIDFSCAQLDDDPFEELAYLPGDDSVVVIDADDGIIWSSITDLEPDFIVRNLGIDAGDLDGDGDVDLLISTRRNDPGMADVPFVVLRNTSTPGTISFTPETALDLALTSQTIKAELLYLNQP